MIEIVDTDGRILGLIDETIYTIPAPQEGRAVRVPVFPGRPRDVQMELRWHGVNVKSASGSDFARWYLIAPDGVYDQAWMQDWLIDLRDEWKGQKKS